MDYHDLQNSVYQNAAMGITALRQIIPAVKDHDMKNILIKQYNGYRKQTELTAEQMKARNMVPSFPPLTSRLMTKAMVTMRVKRDHSNQNVAKMLIKGTNTGIMELTQALNNTSCDEPEAIQSAKNYLSREQRYIESLKPYL